MRMNDRLVQFVSEPSRRSEGIQGAWNNAKVLGKGRVQAIPFMLIMRSNSCTRECPAFAEHYNTSFSCYVTFHQVLHTISYILTHLEIKMVANSGKDVLTL